MHMHTCQSILAHIDPPWRSHLEWHLLLVPIIHLHLPPWTHSLAAFLRVRTFRPLIRSLIGQQRWDQDEAGRAMLSATKLIHPSRFLQQPHTLTHTHLLQTKPLHLQHNGGSPESLSFSLAPGRTVTKRRRRRDGGQEDGDTVENWIRAECCHLEFYQRSLTPKRSSDIMADEFKKRAEQDFHLQFSI